MAENMDVCKICLATNVRSCRIANTPFQQIFEKMTNARLIIQDSCPVVACPPCYSLLIQWHELIEISRQAEALLTEILCQVPEVTPGSVAMIDRKANNLCSPLKTTPVEYFDTSTFYGPITVKHDIELKDEAKFKYKTDEVERQRQTGPVCRLCLVTDVRMYSIAGTPLQNVYENLTDNLLQTADKRPTTVCYVCFARLKKCAKLMLRSSTAEKVLMDLMEKHSKVTKELIATIDRKDLCDSVCIRPMECFDWPGDQQPSEKITEMEIEVKIEVEPDLYVGSPQATDMNGSDDDSKSQSTGRVDAWAVDVIPTEGSASTEAPKRRRRKCAEKTKNTKEIDTTEPRKEKPRRVYKKRIRAYIHTCDICQRVFNRTNHLKDHMKIHTDDRPHECGVCQRRFIQKINLKNHMMTHTGEKPFECELCSSSFIAKSDFKRHMNTHNEERNFECSLCHRKFTQLPYLKAHISTHTSEKPYQCHICERRFSQKPYLKNHLKRHVDRQRD